MCLATTLWLFPFSIVYNFNSALQAECLLSFSYIGITFISIAMLHFTLVFLEIKNLSKILIPLYAYGIICSWLILTSNFLINGVYHYSWGYYPRAGKFHPIYLAIFIGLITLCVILLFYSYSKAKSSFRKRQIGYMLLALFIYDFASIDFIPNYGVAIYPLGYLPTMLMVLIINYSIMFLDVKVAISRTFISFIVYSIVFGLPFGIGIKMLGFGLWIVPTTIALVLATIGMAIYFYLQRKAEDKILEEEIKMQNVLLNVSKDIVIMHDLAKLTHTLVELLMKTLRLQKVFVYLWNEQDNQYKGTTSLMDLPNIAAESDLIKQLEKSKIILSTVDIMFLEGISLYLPLVINNRLLGFIALGNRDDRGLYSVRMLGALEALGNQAALAIENCQLWLREKELKEQIELRERQTSLDHMAGSLAHEINNPMTIISSNVETLKMFMDMGKLHSADEIKHDVDGVFNYIIEAQNRVSAMIKAIKEYSQKREGESFQLVNMNEVEEGFYLLMGAEIRRQKVELIREVEASLLAVWGDKIQLEEILINFAKNALHAVKKQKLGKARMQEKIYKKDDHTIRIEFIDNGYGIEKDMIKDIFLASVTTKASSEGWGLGLYRVRKIVELHKGKLWAESQGKDKGATFIVELPVGKE